MAEALTKRRRGRPKTTDFQERELRRLLLSVCDDTGFRLLLATYDQLKRRDELIARVVRDAEADKVRVTGLDLADAGPETNLVSLLRAHVQETELPPGWRHAVMVTGIERRIDYSSGSEGYTFLRQANLLRDALPEAAPVPVVLWMSRMASAALPAEAPDLWHWRAANLDFTGDETPRLELLRELTTLRPDKFFGASGEQRHGRVRLLEDLLAELERGGSPKTERQVAERADILFALGWGLFWIGVYVRPSSASSKRWNSLGKVATGGARPWRSAAWASLGSTLAKWIGRLACSSKFSRLRMRSGIGRK